MAREASHAYQPADLSERGRPREISIAETLQAQEDARSYVGEHIAMEREAMFVRASRGMPIEKVERARQQVEDQESRLRSRRSTSGAGGELIEIAGYLAGKLDMLGKNARVVPTAKFDDYFNSVDFVIEWDVPSAEGRTETRRIGVDFKGVRSGLGSEERKKEVLSDIERGGPLRDLAFTVSPTEGEKQRYDMLSVPIIPAMVDMHDMQRFYAGLVDPSTRALPDVFDERIQSGLRQKFARDPFRGKLLNSLRENIGTQQHALEQSKNTFKGNEIELKKIDSAILDLKAARDIIDLQRRELGIGDVIPFRTREQQEQETQEKSERTQINKKLDDQEKRIREFFKDFASVFGVTPEEYIASRQTVPTPSKTDNLFERSYDPAAFKKIAKRLPKESTPAHDDQKEKQIRILLTKSPTANEKYLQARQSLEAYRESRPDLKERDAKIDARIEEYLRNDRIVESLLDSLRSQIGKPRSVA